MKEIDIIEIDKTRHEYWEEAKYNLPKADKDRKPYYVCYTYEKKNQKNLRLLKGE